MLHVQFIRMSNTSDPARHTFHLQPDDWAHAEFAHADLGDDRRTRRLVAIASLFAQRPTAPITWASGSWRQAKAAYRFMDNDHIDSCDISLAHETATLGRLGRQDLVLVAQDTSYLDFSAHPATQGLGSIGTNPKNPERGAVMHCSLAMTAQGLPLGLIDSLIFTRKAKRAKAKRVIKEKESRKWLQSLAACQEAARAHPQTAIVNIADREADIYEFLAMACEAEAPPNCHVLVRAKCERKLQDSEQSLWQRVSKGRVAERYSVQLRRRDGRPQRKARMSLRHSKVTIKPPVKLSHLGSIEVWAVLAREVGAPKGVDPVCWKLLSTMPVTTVAQARRCVQWYGLRWQIEVYFKVLKSGCGIERRQLRSLDRLRRALAIDQAAASRILALTMAARELPERSCELWLGAAQWRALWTHIHRKRRTPSRAPTIRQAVMWIGRLGGHMGRANDGPPGPITLWRGYERLSDLTRMWEVCHAKAN